MKGDQRRDTCLSSDFGRHVWRRTLVDKCDVGLWSTSVTSDFGRHVWQQTLVDILWSTLVCQSIDTHWLWSTLVCQGRHTLVDTCVSIKDVTLVSRRHTCPSIKDVTRLQSTCLSIKDVTLVLSMNTFSFQWMPSHLFFRQMPLKTILWAIHKRRTTLQSLNIKETGTSKRKGKGKPKKEREKEKGKEKEKGERNCRHGWIVIL